MGIRDYLDALLAARSTMSVPDSGRAFRSLILGLNRIPRGAVRCPVLCVSGAADRNVSARISRSIAARFDAEHHVFPGRGHWLIAESAVEEVAPTVLSWLTRVVGPGVSGGFNPATPRA